MKGLEQPIRTKYIYTIIVFIFRLSLITFCTCCWTYKTKKQTHPISRHVCIDVDGSQQITPNPGFDEWIRLMSDLKQTLNKTV